MAVDTFVDTFTEACRWAALVLGIALVLTIGEIIRYWVVQRRRERRVEEQSLGQCHCRVVNAPHDWEAHKDWVRP